jgi:protein-tyrosine phosphatase
LIDFHNHLAPGVDDGAADVEQARAALEQLTGQGVHTLVATPHLLGSLTARPERLHARLAELDAGWDRLRQAAAEFPALRLERGAEVMLDTLSPDLADPRTRLAGTTFALVEFAHMSVPPNAEQPLLHLKRDGWTPVLAHPERYSGFGSLLGQLERWRTMGAHLQVNAGSLLGRYGSHARDVAWRLVELGWADYLSSDYHARGRLSLEAARKALLARGGEHQAELLLETNAARLLAGDPPLEVPPLPPPRSLLGRIFGR